MKKTLNIIVSVLFGVGLYQTAWAQQVTKGNLDQNADQAQGNYAATNLNYLGSGSLGMMQSAWKDPLQHMGEGQTKPGYSKYYWTPELVLPVRLREGMYTLINFPNWEMIESVYLGDQDSFDATIQGPSSLMVYPQASKFVGVDTNMIVFGRSGNKYVFYVQSETVNTDRITNSVIDIEVVKRKNTQSGGSGYVDGSGSSYGKDYSQDGLSVDSTYTRDLQKEDWIEKIPVDPTKFRFDIEVYVPNPDDIIIAPERVWRDNIFTYIDLGEKALTSVQRPIVTLIVERSETPVGFRAAGPHNRLIIVEGMGDMVLRSGKRLVCLKLRRADTDGLENAVYAKSNEWDLQTAYASQPEGESVAGKTAIEDVYGDSAPAETQKSTQQNMDFFNSNSFSAKQTAPTKDVNVPVTNGGMSMNNENVLDALPKVTPVVAHTPSKEDNAMPTVTGQMDINTPSGEMIVPDYNGQPVKADVIYQPQVNVASQENKQKDTIANPVALGTSENNSSPVLIRPKKDISKEKTLISKETEALLQEFRNGKALEKETNSNISIELGTDENVNNLEKLWSDISKRYSAALGKYQPFYSVEAPADGQGKDLFHLRVGPVKTLDEGDHICSQLGRNGIFCSVVRIQ